MQLPRDSTEQVSVHPKGSKQRERDFAVDHERGGMLQSHVSVAVVTTPF